MIGQGHRLGNEELQTRTGHYGGCTLGISILLLLHTPLGRRLCRTYIQATTLFLGFLTTEMELRAWWSHLFQICMAPTALSTISGWKNL